MRRILILADIRPMGYRLSCCGSLGKDFLFKSILGHCDTVFKIIQLNLQKNVNIAVSICKGKLEYPYLPILGIYSWKHGIIRINVLYTYILWKRRYMKIWILLQKVFHLRCDSEDQHWNFPPLLFFSPSAISWKILSRMHGSCLQNKEKRQE